MTDINEDGFTLDDVQTTMNVLSVLKERAENNGEDNEYADISQTMLYTHNYEQESEWRQERPSDRVDLSNNATLDSCVERSGDD